MTKAILKLYGFSDLYLDGQAPAKYQKIYDIDGIEIGEVECYYIEDGEYVEL